MVKARAVVGTRLSEIGCVVAEDDNDAAQTRESWDALARNAELERYLDLDEG